MLEQILDGALDFTVAPGFSRLGYEVRRRSWSPLPRMDGRTVAVTGATSGLGRAAAQGFADLGATVILLVRDVTRGNQVAEEIGGAQVIECDLASLASVHAAAAQITTLDVLVNNAGVLPPQRTQSKDGYELTWAVNVLGTFALTEALQPKLNPGGRVITVSSGGMYSRGLDFDDLQAERGDFDGVRAYALTKRAQVVLTDEWTRRYAERPVRFYAMHPGWADTPGVQESLPRFHRLLGPALRTPAQGADTVLWLAAVIPAPPGGGFWHDRRRRAEHRLTATRERAGDGERLYELCAAMTKEQR